MTTFTCVTSRYLPNMRYLSRLFEAERVVVLDLAPVPDRNRNSFVNRNYFSNADYTKSGWLTVPIHRSGRAPITEVKIDETDHRWIRKHIGLINNLSPRNEELSPGFVTDVASILSSNRGYLLPLNLELTRHVVAYLGFGRWEPLMQSDLVLGHSKEHRLEVARELSAKRYIAGHVEWELMKADGQLEAFLREGIEVIRSGGLDPNEFDSRVLVSNSCVHAICCYGVEFASNVLKNIIAVLSTSR